MDQSDETIPNVSRGCLCHSRSLKQFVLVPLLALNGLFVILWGAHSTSFAPMVETERMRIQILEELKLNHTASTVSPSNPVGYVRYPKIFGHLHYAKTAGTEINGELAAHFERVCGHKGSSHDAYQFQVRYRREQVPPPPHHQNTRATSTTDGSSSTKFISEAMTSQDCIAKAYPTYNRGRVPENIMLERGFEDCDWISIESSWEMWAQILPDYPIELHVPCRDPIEHLMSQCNQKGKVFDCNSMNLRKEVYGCLVGWIRFDNGLQNDTHLSLKCFDPVPIRPYLDYIGQFLERKRIENDYISRATNPTRNKTTECIWTRTDLHRQVRQLLTRLDYYRFCATCMGSEDDLLLEGPRTADNE